MARVKPSKLRDIGAGLDQHNIDRMSVEEARPLLDVKGIVTPIRRRASVFTILRESGSITPNQADAAIRLMDIYATMQRVGEPPERDDSIIRSTGTDPQYKALMAARSVNAARSRYKTLTDRVGPVSADLLTTLFHDFLECDHEPPVRNASGKVVARWRVKVRGFYAGLGKPLATPNEENLAVWVAVEELGRIM